MSEKLMVSKSNTLINAGYRLSITEKQLILYVISLINPLDENFKLEYEIDIKEFAKLFNKNHTKIYHDIKNAVLDKLIDRKLRFKDSDDKVTIIHWINKVQYQNKTGFLKLRFNEEIVPFLHQLKKHFTSYYLQDIKSFDSCYSIRIYEYLVMQINRSKKINYSFNMTINQLKTNLGIISKYKQFCDFNKRVLKVAQTEINKFSNLEMQYKIIKRGRSPHEIEFIVHKKVKVNVEHEAHKTEVQKPISCKVPPKTLELAKNMAAKAGTKWDIYHIEGLFYEDVKEKGMPDSIEAAFIGKVKKCIKYPA